MRHLAQYSIFWIFLIFSSCSLQQSDVIIKNGYNRFNPALQDVDFKGDCRIQLRTLAINQSGRCKFVLSGDDQFQISLLHPFGGTLLQSYLNEDIVQVLDSINENFIQSKNTEKNRRKILGDFDLTLGELQQIFMGRESPDNRSISFLYEKGIPTGAYVRGIRVEYKKWMRYEKIVLPRIFVIEDKKIGSRIKIAFTHVQLTASEGKNYRLLNGFEVEF